MVPSDLLIYGLNNNKYGKLRLYYPDILGGYVAYIGPDLNNLNQI